MARPTSVEVFGRIQCSADLLSVNSFIEISSSHGWTVLSR
jgi:hypothetical protein